MRDSPALIHFTTEFKPWNFHPFHPLRESFYERLDQTAWAGWRPERPDFSLKRWWDLTAVYWIRKWVVNYRKARSLFA
jgi:lipopolysaccharide biosynthesis glycosyltransferase